MDGTEHQNGFQGYAVRNLFSLPPSKARNLSKVGVTAPQLKIEHLLKSSPPDIHKSILHWLLYLVYRCLVAFASGGQIGSECIGDRIFDVPSENKFNTFRQASANVEIWNSIVIPCLAVRAFYKTCPFIPAAPHSGNAFVRGDVGQLRQEGHGRRMNALRAKKTLGWN